MGIDGKFSRYIIDGILLGVVIGVNGVTGKKLENVPNKRLSVMSIAKGALAPQATFCRIKDKNCVLLDGKTANAYDNIGLVHF